MTKGASSNSTMWRSLASKAGLVRGNDSEFEPGAETLSLDPVSRRHFLGVMGASTALAGTLTGCVRKEQEHILPYTRRPEDLVDGESRYFASNLFVGGSVVGVLVESQDGRPTKIEGNPEHPSSLGGAGVWAQAAVLEMYDPDRSRTPLRAGESSTWDEAWGALEAAVGPARGAGAGVALVINAKPSPTFRRLVRAFQTKFPQARVFSHDLANPSNTRSGTALAGIRDAHPVYDLSKADVVVSLDADFLGSGVDSTRLTRQFAARRTVDHANVGAMNRLYVIEPHFSVTGANADNRLQVSASQVGAFARVLAKKLLEGSNQPPGSEPVVAALAPAADDTLTKWAEAISKDVSGRRGKAVFIVGERQPAWLHALGHALNAAVGANGTIVSFQPEPDAVQVGTAAEFAQAIGAGQVKTAILVDVNPVYDSPGAVGFDALLSKVEQSFHLGFHPSETAVRASWHLPMSHALESWGDLRSWDGTLGVQQPLIAPLFESVSEIEFLARIESGTAQSGYELVRDAWQKNYSGVDFERDWRRTVHAGFSETPNPSVTPDFQWTQVASAIAAAKPLPAPSTSSLELVFGLDNKTYDGRYANNAWLQELPDPVTKITWDNALLMSPATARELGIRFGSADDVGREHAERVKLTIDGREKTVPVFAIPGVAAGTVVLALGYGRSFKASVATAEVGVNSHDLRPADGSWFAAGATLARTGETYQLATTQDHSRMRGDGEKQDRPIARHATAAEFSADKDVVRKGDVMPPEKLKSLWEEPNKKDGHQWGMVIDLTTCTGCNACTVACQAENNIPVVGKERVLNGREMHWIRLDRYFVGDDENQPKLITQPMACSHCETAPCEQVCPVAATVHSPEGLNDMAYNRCVGTRYCSNNCPFKVRRFNFFNYNKENDETNPLLRLQRSHDVTVRFRGVMEKCTYCVQRINSARIDAKKLGNGIIPDGAITPACAQACPASAITFGNINDPESRVSRLRKLDQNYAVLEWLNIRPRTTYLAKISNPNPELG